MKPETVKIVKTVLYAVASACAIAGICIESDPKTQKKLSREQRNRDKEFQKSRH